MQHLYKILCSKYKESTPGEADLIIDAYATMLSVLKRVMLAITFFLSLKTSIAKYCYQ